MINKQKFPNDLYINLHTTNRCNLRCRYCYDYKKLPVNADYDIRRLINFLKNYRVKYPTIIFFGGEPLCNINFIEEIIKKLDYESFFKKVSYQLQTNGTLLNTSPKEILKKFELIHISFDGQEKTMDYLRGKNTYNKIIDNLKYLQDNNIINSIIGRITLTPSKILKEDLLEVYKIFNYIHFQIDHTLERKDYNFFLKNYKEALSFIMKRWIYDIKKKRNKKFIMPFISIVECLEDNKKSNNNYYLHCLSGYKGLTIDVFGRIYACPEGTASSVHSDAKDCYIGTINDKKLVPNLYKFNKKCQNCKIFYICRGRCRWTKDEIYCKTTNFIIELVKKNKKIINKYIKSYQSKELEKVLYCTETIP